MLDYSTQRMQEAVRMVRICDAQLAIREAASRHAHVGACMSSTHGSIGDVTVGGYDPNDCDCIGPELARKQVEFDRRVIQLWKQSGWVARAVLVDLVEALYESLTPAFEVCWRCKGDGMYREEGATARSCPSCDGRGMRLRARKRQGELVGTDS